MVNWIFSKVAYGLLWTGKKTGLTYNEVNIIVYYLLIPLSWTIMLDCWLGIPVTTCALLCIWLGLFIATRHTFSLWCDRAFEDSVSFLNRFNRLGSNYVLSSVIICVAIPIAIYVLLILLVI
ncbi:MAG: hypothetical protein K2K98_05535 [Muribaculaceae bacterium]|nr:hypothetical protein [Muribaculaceae bacterium]